MITEALQVLVVMNDADRGILGSRRNRKVG
jgi:hypothetical protein